MCPEYRGGMDLEAAAQHCLARLSDAGVPLRALYRQPDRAIYLAEASCIVLKVYVDAAALRREWAVAQRARAAALPVPELLAFAPGPPAVIAMRHVAGRPLTSGQSDAAREAGALLARFHRLGARPPFATGRATWEEHIAAWAERELARLDRLGILRDEQIAALRQSFADQRDRLAARPIALLHGDLQPAHIIVDRRGERVVALLDFADAQPGDPLLDIAVLTLRDGALIGPVLAGYGQIADDAATRALLATYRLLRHLAEVPWLLERGFTALAARNIAAIDAVLDSALLTDE